MFWANHHARDVLQVLSATWSRLLILFCRDHVLLAIIAFHTMKRSNSALTQAESMKVNATLNKSFLSAPLVPTQDLSLQAPLPLPRSRFLNALLAHPATHARKRR